MTAPSALLQAVSALPASTEVFIADHEPLFTCIDNDFPFIRNSQRQSLTATEIATWAALLRWLVAELNAWTAINDPHGTRLLTLLALSTAMKPAAVWPSLSPLVAGNRQLALGLDVVVRLQRQHAIPLADAPRWERDLVEQFRANDQTMAWDGIDEVLPALMPSFLPSWTMIEVGVALAEISLSQLEQSSAALSGVFDVVSLMAGLPDQVVAQLAKATSSERVRFVAVHRLGSARSQLPAVLASLIADALVQVSQDPIRWDVWMRTFVRYPVRFPALQHPLGLALGRVTPAAQKAYLQTLAIEDSSDARRLATICFEAFRSTAPISVRQTVWSMAYSRWCGWDFDGATAALGPVRSALDYALIGYAIETLTLLDLQNLLQEFQDRFDEVDCNWYGSLIDCVVARNRAASRILPFQHAGSIHGTAQPWLDLRSPTLPPTARSPYLDIKFRTR
jgi:hypothetical protein